MALKVRFLYDEPNPIPASDWGDVKHGAIIMPPVEVAGVQFIDDEADPDDVPSITALINMTLAAITDEDGYLIGADVDPDERAAVRAAVAACRAGMSVEDALRGLL